MTAPARQTIALGLIVWFLGTPAAFGADGIQIAVTNDGTEDIMVTVYDTSSKPGRMLISHQRINGFTAVPVTALPDDSGQANLSWSATTVDPTSRKCGHANNVQLADAAVLNVHADAECGT